MRVIPLEVRLWSRVTITDERVPGVTGPCWLYTGTLHPGGYGRIMDGGRQLYTHRLAYELLVGPIPAELQMDHLCRVRACCNPDHLEPVTARENLMRGETLTAAHAAGRDCGFPACTNHGASRRRYERAAR